LAMQFYSATNGDTRPNRMLITRNLGDLILRGRNCLNYDEINYNELIKIASMKTSAFLCGNGFSINFDNDYKLSNLVERLYKTHCHIKLYESYDIVSNEKYKTSLTENYNSFCRCQQND